MNVIELKKQRDWTIQLIKYRVPTEYVLSESIPSQYGEIKRISNSEVYFATNGVEQSLPYSMFHLDTLVLIYQDIYDWKEQIIYQNADFYFAEREALFENDRFRIDVVGNLEIEKSKEIYKGDRAVHFLRNEYFSDFYYENDDDLEVHNGHLFSICSKDYIEDDLELNTLDECIWWNYLTSVVDLYPYEYVYLYKDSRVLLKNSKGEIYISDLDEEMDEDFIAVKCTDLNIVDKLELIENIYLYRD